MTNARFSIVQAKAVDDERVSNAQFRTLAALGKYGDKDGWCWPSLTTLGNALGKSKQAVSKDIEALVEYGYVEKYPQFENNVQKPNLYRLVFDQGGQPGVDGVSTSEVDGVSTSEIDQNVPLNAPVNNVETPKKSWSERRAEAAERIKKQREGKGDLVDFLLAETDRERSVKDMEDRVHKALGFRVPERWRKERTIEWLIEQEAAGRTIEAWAKGYENDATKYDMPRKHQLSQNPGLLRDFWDLVPGQTSIEEQDCGRRFGFTMSQWPTEREIEMWSQRVGREKVEEYLECTKKNKSKS